MPLFFFDVVDGTDIMDDSGTELPDIDVAKEEAVVLAGSLLKDDAKRFWNGDEWTVKVRDANGLMLFELTVFARISPAISEVKACRCQQKKLDVGTPGQSAEGDDPLPFA